MTVTVRFAPSPTGYLHIGNVRTAVLNRLFALKHCGRFILRLDDTDTARSREEYAQAIVEDLRWLGMEPDAVERQSARMPLYREAAEQLKAAGLLYPCYETEQELALKRKAQIMAGRPPVYDRSALKLTEAARRALEEAGRRPHWRFRLPEGVIRWEDAVRGPVEIDLATLSDPVLMREDGTFLYTLPSVVDDIDMGITHVIRGDDHVTNTAVQIALTRALGGEAPVYAHHSLLVDRDGGGLSKRLGSLGVRNLRERGLEPETIVSYCATIASSEPVRVFSDMKKLAESLELSKLSRSPARFDEAELEALNARLLHDMPAEIALPRLEALGISMDAALWEAIRGNIAHLREAADWIAVAHGDITPLVAAEDRDFVRRAAQLLPPEPWDPDTWKTWTAKVKAETGRKGKALFMPLRLVLTGKPHGPEMSRLLPIIGRERVLKRLTG